MRYKEKKHCLSKNYLCLIGGNTSKDNMRCFAKNVRSTLKGQKDKCKKNVIQIHSISLTFSIIRIMQPFINCCTNCYLKHMIHNRLRLNMFCTFMYLHLVSSARF